MITTDLQRLAKLLIRLQDRVYKGKAIDITKAQHQLTLLINQPCPVKLLRSRRLARFLVSKNHQEPFSIYNREIQQGIFIKDALAALGLLAGRVKTTVIRDKYIIAGFDEPRLCRNWWADEALRKFRKRDCFDSRKNKVNPGVSILDAWLVRREGNVNVIRVAYDSK